MSYEYLDADRIKVHDFIEYYEDGYLVANVPATFDFSQVEDRFRDLVISLAVSRNFQHFGTSPDVHLAWQRYWEEDAKRSALPFFKRIFTPRPKMPGLEYNRRQ